MDVLLIAGVPAAVWAMLVGALARRRQVPVAPWVAVTFVAALLMFMASIALPSLNPGTGRVIAAVIQISGAVWCLLAPIFILRRPRREASKASDTPESRGTVSQAETDGTIEMAKMAGMAQMAEWVEEATADMPMDMSTDVPLE